MQTILNTQALHLLSTTGGPEKLQTVLTGGALHILTVIVGFFSTLLLGVLIYIWKRQEKKTDELAETMIELAKALDEHKLQVTKDHATHEDLKELQRGLYKR